MGIDTLHEDCGGQPHEPLREICFAHCRIPNAAVAYFRTGTSGRNPRQECPLWTESPCSTPPIVRLEVVSNAMVSNQLAIRNELECAEQRTTTVAETSVTLRVEQILHGEAELVDRGLVLFLEAQVEQGIVERSTEEELERQVVDALGGLLGVIDCGARQFSAIGSAKDLNSSESAAYSGYRSSLGSTESIVERNDQLSVRSRPNQGALGWTDPG